MALTILATATLRNGFARLFIAKKRKSNALISRGYSSICDSIDMRSDE